MTQDSIGEGFVIRDWLQSLAWKEQTVLLTAIRGCDNRPIEDPVKPIIQEYRSIVLHDAVPSENDGFMKKFNDEERDRFLKHIDEYPLHWFKHFLHAVEIVGYKHPDDDIRDRWNNLYVKLCRDGLKVNTEKSHQLDERLSDGK
jgi:hypothetical protein